MQLKGLRKLCWIREYDYVRGRIGTLQHSFEDGRYHLALCCLVMMIVASYFISIRQGMDTKFLSTNPTKLP